MKKKGFTLIEVIVALCIFSLLSLAFLSNLKFSIEAHKISVQRHELVVEGETALEMVIDEMKSYKSSEMTSAVLTEIAQKNSSKREEFEVNIMQTTSDNLYIGEIIFRESRYEKLCTKIYIP